MAKRKRRTYPDAMASPTKNITYGYVGFWRNGDLGWVLPNHAGGNKWQTEGPGSTDYVQNEDRFALCRITIEVVPGVRLRRHPMRPKRKA